MQVLRLLFREHPTLGFAYEWLLGKILSSRYRNCIKVAEENLEERTVITSDHGESFSKFGVYGHPRGVRFRHLVEVPWLESYSR